METYYVMVLNDGETYSDLSGCVILRVEGDQDIDTRVKDFVQRGIGDDVHRVTTFE